MDIKLPIYENLSINNLDGEIFKDVVGYEGLYKISNLGRVKALNKNGNNKKKDIIRIQRVNQFGYLTFNICKNNKKKFIQIHRLVAESFIPNPENKPEVNHKKGIKTDNRVSELEWSTRIENASHSYYVLNNKSGIKKAQKKANEVNTIFKENEIKNVLIKRASGISCIEIAKEYGVNRVTITKVIRENKVKFGVNIPNNLPRVFHKTKEEIHKKNLEIGEKRGKPVLLYDINNNFIKRFTSKRDLAREFNLDTKCITKCCNGIAKQHKGFIIKNENNEKRS
jgi:hypothetical protein